MKQLITALMFTLFAVPAVADVTYTPETRSLSVTGGTTDWQSILIHSAFRDNEIDTVYMSGPGGLLHAGFYIGRLLKEHQVRVIIPSATECASACAFAALGGEDVITDGALLFHRPYFMQVPTMVTVEDIGAHSAMGYILWIEYMVEMGYPIAFVSHVTGLTNPCTFVQMFGEIEDYKGEPLDTIHAPATAIINKCGGEDNGS